MVKKKTGDGFVLSAETLERLRAHGKPLLQKGTVGTWDNRIIFRDGLFYMINGNGSGFSFMMDNVDGSAEPFVVPAEVMFGTLGGLKSDATVTVTDKQVRIEAGRLKVRARLMEADQAPRWIEPPSSEPNEWKKLKNGTWKSLLAISMASGDSKLEDRKPELAGVYIKGGIAVAADGLRGAITQLKQNDLFGFLSSRFLSMVSKIGVEPTSLCIRDGITWAEVLIDSDTPKSSTTIFCTNPALPYPSEIVNVLTKEVKAKRSNLAVWGDSKALYDTVERLKVFSGFGGIEIEGTAEGLVLRTHSERGDAEEFFDAEVTGTFKRSFGVDMLASTIAVSKAMFLSSEGRGIFQARTGKVFFVLMPLAVQISE